MRNSVVVQEGVFTCDCGNQVVQHLARYSEIATCRLARIVGRSRVAEDVKV